MLACWMQERSTWDVRRRNAGPRRIHSRPFEIAPRDRDTRRAPARRSGGRARVLKTTAGERPRASPTRPSRSKRSLDGKAACASPAPDGESQSRLRRPRRARGHCAAGSCIRGGRKTHVWAPRAFPPGRHRRPLPMPRRRPAPRPPAQRGGATVAADGAGGRFARGRSPNQSPVFCGRLPSRRATFAPWRARGAAVSSEFPTLRARVRAHPRRSRSLRRCDGERFARVADERRQQRRTRRAPRRPRTPSAPQQGTRRRR